MPLMNGFEASRWIREMTNTRIIAVTANESARNSPLLPSSGIESVILKPFTGQQLRSII